MAAPDRPELTAPPVDDRFSTETWPCDECSGDYVVPVIRLGSEVKRYPRPSGLCDGCEDRKRKREEAEARVAAVRKRAEPSNSAYVDRLKSFGIFDPKLWRCSLDNFDASESPEALNAAVRFVDAVLEREKDGPMRWLFLCGPTGNGKTHLVVGIDRALWVAGYRGRVILDVMPAFVRQVQRSYSKSPGLADKLIQARIDCDVWLCDDLGRGKQTADSVRIANEIGCERTMRPTAFSSNYLRTGLADRHADYETLVSRLGPACCRTIEMKGRDRRDDRQGEPLESA